jgi:hypothetical protein
MMGMRWTAKGQGLCPWTPLGSKRIRLLPPDPRDLRRQGKEGACSDALRPDGYAPSLPCLLKIAGLEGHPPAGVQGAEPHGLALGHRKPIRP